MPSESPTMAEAVRGMLADHWLADGYTMPNAATYPWQWLWDSCFHALTWSHLGDERALTELERIFSFQTASGFVPHMNYLPDPEAALPFWKQTNSSTITQPPMYGHAVAELVDRGMVPSDRVIDSAVKGMRFLLRDRRRSATGLIELCHPWESGCDDSARWDSAIEAPWHPDRWRHHKIDLLEHVRRGPEGEALANDRFAVASIGFNALVAFNAFELARVTGAADLVSGASELSQIIGSRWDDALATWTDDGALAPTSGRVRTVDAHLALLVDQDRTHVARGLSDLVDESAFGARFGPAGVHRDEPTREPLRYWRGSTWPQLSYLLWVAARRLDDQVVASSIATSLQSGAGASGLAEYWHPDTGEGGGARPQSWAALALLVADA